MGDVRTLLMLLKNGELSIDEVVSQLPFEDTGFAKIDHDRKKRTGYPEVIFGQGKTPEQAAEIFSRLASTGNAVICTRASREIAVAISACVKDVTHHSNANLVILDREPVKKVGLVAIATGGTSDIYVAEEAALILETFGSNVARLYDVGVAGVHRLLAQQETLHKANCIIAVAGMEGALPSVVSGLVNVPVIAVPTSVGYGANQGGMTTLLAMLCSCAAGVSVVNIDNGFGAAYQADMINKATASAITVPDI